MAVSRILRNTGKSVDSTIFLNGNSGHIINTNILQLHSFFDTSKLHTVIRHITYSGDKGLSYYLVYLASLTHSVTQLIYQ